MNIVAGEERVCNLCSSKKIERYRYIPRLDRQLLRCKQCGLVFVDPAATACATFDFEDPDQREQRHQRMTADARNEGKFDEAVLRREEKTRTSHFRNRKKEIERYIKPTNILDVGCGRGFFLANFLKDDAQYLGIEPRTDVSEDAAKRVGRERIFCGTLQEAKVPANACDLVAMINLIEHLPDPKETLREVNRVMKMNGIMFVETPDEKSMLPRLLRHRWHGFLEHEHHYFFSKDTLKRMLEDTGFSVVKMRRGDKLFSVAYLLFRLGWYSPTARVYLEKILASAGILNKTVRVPQLDELIFIAKKVNELD